MNVWRRGDGEKKKRRCDVLGWGSRRNKNGSSHRVVLKE